MVFLKERFYSDQWKVAVIIFSSALEEKNALLLSRICYDSLLGFGFVVWVFFWRGRGVSWMSFFLFNNPLW